MLDPTPLCENIRTCEARSPTPSKDALACGYCDGQGVVKVPRAACNGFKEWIMCPRCNGTMFVEPSPQQTLF